MKAGSVRRWALGLLVAGAATAAVTTTTGCGGNFDPYNRLKSLRVLAIRSIPVAPAAAPSAGETTSIDARVYTPVDTEVSYEWTWCPVASGAGVACPISEAQASLLAGGPISYRLGTTAAVTFPYVLPTAMLQALCDGQGGMVAVDCTGGFPIQIKLTVRTSDDEVQAVRPMHLRFRDSDEPNANPTLGGLYAVIDGANQPLDAATLAPLPRHTATVIGAAITDGDSEMYNGKDNDGNPASVHERLNLSWFVESGDTNHQRTACVDCTDAAMLATASQLKWTPAYFKDEKYSPKLNPDVAKVIVIIRDDREGVGWAEGAAALEMMP